jgi:hypothetical protein
MSDHGLATVFPVQSIDKLQWTTSETKILAANHTLTKKGATADKTKNIENFAASEDTDSNIQNTIQIPVVITKFAEGKYNLYRVIWNRDHIKGRDVELNGAIEITHNFVSKVAEVAMSVNMEETPSERSLASVKALGREYQPEVVELEIMTTEIKGDAIFPYDGEEGTYSVTIRKLAENDIVVSPINGPYKGARFFFSTENKDEELRRIIASNNNVVIGNNVPFNRERTNSLVQPLINKDLEQNNIEENGFEF